MPKLPRPSKLSRALLGRRLACLGVLCAFFVACGVRSPLDTDGLPGSAAQDASADADAALQDALPADAAPDTAPKTDAGTDARPPIPGPLGCGVCVAETCGPSIVACVADTNCRTLLQCVSSGCLGGSGGGINTACLLGCAGKNPQALAQVLQLFTCLTGKCGADCTDLLGLLGGLGGGGGGGGGGGSGSSSGKPAAPSASGLSPEAQRDAWNRAFEQYPGLCAAPPAE